MWQDHIIPARALITLSKSHDAATRGSESEDNEREMTDDEQSRFTGDSNLSEI